MFVPFSTHVTKMEAAGGGGGGGGASHLVANEAVAVAALVNGLALATSHVTSSPAGTPVTVNAAGTAPAANVSG